MLPNLSIIEPNREELYTFDYAHNFISNKQNSIKPYIEVYNFISKNFPNINFNAGHDLNLDNLSFFLKEMPLIKEVSIGHALVIDAINLGLKETIKRYHEITNFYKNI